MSSAAACKLKDSPEKNILFAREHDLTGKYGIRPYEYNAPLVPPMTSSEIWDIARTEPATSSPLMMPSSIFFKTAMENEIRPGLNIRV